MKIAVIKSLVESHTLERLRKAEEDVLAGVAGDFEIPGNDEGEKLTHVLAAIEILENMQTTGKDIRTALREFSERVRNSIS